jgi:hypothetical protein
MFPDVEEVRIAGYDKGSLALDGRGDVLVIVRQILSPRQPLAAPDGAAAMAARGRRLERADARRSRKASPRVICRKRLDGGA